MADSGSGLKNRGGQNNKGGNGSRQNNLSGLQGGGMVAPSMGSALAGVMSRSQGGHNSTGTPATYAPSSGVSPPTMHGGGPFQPPDPSNVFPSTPYTPVQDLFMSQNLRSKFQSPPASTARNTTVASSKFSHYTQIVNLEQKPTESSLCKGQQMQVYRTTNRFNGKHVLLRRIVGTTASPQHCAAVCDKLRQFRHPNLVPLHSITATNEFVLGSNDVIVEYRLIRRAKSFTEYFLAPVGTPHLEISEGILWSITCQLVALIRTFHEVQTPLRGLHISKLLFLDVVNRVYFSGLGLVETTEQSALPLEALLRQDLQQLGYVLLQLATRTLNVSMIDVPAQIARLGGRCSKNFCSLVQACLDGSCGIDKLCTALSDRLAMEIGHQEGHADFFLTECAKEVHNGRLMRLMIKLNFVLESQEPQIADFQDPLYTLRSFQQYVFNQADESGRARLDWGHVYHSLNKLDCGSEDLLQLISADGNNQLLVISFKDIGSLLENCFAQMSLQPTTNEPMMLVRGTTPPSMPQ